MRCQFSGMSCVLSGFLSMDQSSPAELRLPRLVGYRYICHCGSVPRCRSDSQLGWQAEMSQLGGKYTRPKKEARLGSSVRASSESGFWGWNPELGKAMQSPTRWSSHEEPSVLLSGRWVLPSNLALGFFFLPLLIFLQHVN